VDTGLCGIVLLSGLHPSSVQYGISTAAAAAAAENIGLSRMPDPSSPYPNVKGLTFPPASPAHLYALRLKRMSTDTQVVQLEYRNLR